MAAIGEETDRFDPVKQTARFHASIGSLDFQAIESFFTADAIYASHGVGTCVGRNEIMAAFRRYFDEYPNQVAQDSLIEAVSTTSARSVWRLSAVSTLTGLALIRHGEEVITFDTDGKILRVDVTDRVMPT